MQNITKDVCFAFANVTLDSGKKNHFSAFIFNFFLGLIPID